MACSPLPLGCANPNSRTRGLGAPQEVRGRRAPPSRLCRRSRGACPRAPAAAAPAAATRIAAPPAGPVPGHWAGPGSPGRAGPGSPPVPASGATRTAVGVLRGGVPPMMNICKRGHASLLTELDSRVAGGGERVAGARPKSAEIQEPPRPTGPERPREGRGGRSSDNAGPRRRRTQSS